MCTSVMLRSLDGQIIIGRNMDFATGLDPDVCFVPEGFSWSSIADPATTQVNTHSYVAAGQGDEKYVLVAEGVNDANFGGCELYFSDFASYGDPSDPRSEKRRLASSEFLGYCLGMCTSVQDLPDIIASTELVGIPDPYTKVVAPLHWIFADKTGACVVIESTVGSFKLYENPLGVMTNSPDFPWHMTNLRNYLSLKTEQQTAADWDGLALETFAQGFGVWGMPGDHNPTSRFIKTAFQKTHLEALKTGDEAVLGCFHLLDSVSIPKGVVILPSGNDEHTLYTSVMNLTDPSYFFTTYDNREIVRADVNQLASQHTTLTHVGKMIRPTTFSTF